MSIPIRAERRQALNVVKSRHWNAGKRTGRCIGGIGTAEDSRKLVETRDEGEATGQGNGKDDDG